MEALVKTSSVAFLLLVAAGTLPAAADPLHPVVGHGGYASQVPAILPPSENVEARVKSVGLAPLSYPLRVGPTYLIHAVDQHGTVVRVVLGAAFGDILLVEPIAVVVRHATPQDTGAMAHPGPAPATQPPHTEGRTMKRAPQAMAMHPAPDKPRRPAATPARPLAVAPARPLAVAPARPLSVTPPAEAAMPAPEAPPAAPPALAVAPTQPMDRSMPPAVMALPEPQKNGDEPSPPAVEFPAPAPLDAP
jgi:hypothetical protein